LSVTNTGSSSGVAGRPGALAGRVDHSLPDRLGVAGRHPKAVAGERLAQRRPGGAQLGRGRVDRAEAFGELEGALDLAAVGQEPAGLSAHPPLQRRQARLGEGGFQGVAVDAEPLGGHSGTR
jgi:hypothetical protein